MRLKPLVAWIMKSRTYQLSATPDADQRRRRGEFLARGRPAAAGRGAARRHQPGRSAVPERFRRAPSSLRAAQLPGRRRRRRVLEDLRQARPAADLRMRAVRVDDAGPGVPDDQRRDGAQASWSAIDNRIGKRLEAGLERFRAPDELYLAALCREPTEAERARRDRSPRAAPAIDAQAWEDVVWALLNSKEFLLRH